MIDFYKYFKKNWFLISKSWNSVHIHDYCEISTHKAFWKEETVPRGTFPRDGKNGFGGNIDLSGSPRLATKKSRTSGIFGNSIISKISRKLSYPRNPEIQTISEIWTLRKPFSPDTFPPRNFSPKNLSPSSFCSVSGKSFSGGSFCVQKVLGAEI